MPDLRICYMRQLGEVMRCELGSALASSNSPLYKLDTSAAMQG